MHQTSQSNGGFRACWLLINNGHSNNQSYCDCEKNLCGSSSNLEIQLGKTLKRHPYDPKDKILTLEENDAREYQFKGSKQSIQEFL